MKSKIIAALAVACTALAVGGCGGGTPTNGYYNATTLQNSVVTQFNSTLPPSEQASAASCVMNGRTAKCLLTLNTGNKAVEDITISASGNNYVGNAG